MGQSAKSAKATRLGQVKSKIQQAPTLILENSTAKDGNLNKLKLNLIVCLSLFYLAPAQTAFGQEVVFNTREAASIGDFNFSAGDFVKYNMQTGAAEVYFAEDNFTTVGTNDINPDAISILSDSNFLFSVRGAAALDGTTITSRQLVVLNISTRNFDVLLEEFGQPGQSGFDISGIDVIDNDNVLLAAKSPTTIGGLAYSVGDIVQYTFSTGTAETVFSADNFLTAEEGGRFTAPANIDAVARRNNGNLLFSTTNTAQVEFGDDPQNAVQVNQASVYEYNATTGETTEFFDGTSIFSSNSDIKSFSIVPASVTAIPEPSSILISGLAGLLLVARRRKTSY